MLHSRGSASGNLRLCLLAFTIMQYLGVMLTASVSEQTKEEEQEAARFDAVFPCILSIMPAAVFNKKDPIVVGVDVVEGIAKVGRSHSQACNVWELSLRRCQHCMLPAAKGIAVTLSMLPATGLCGWKQPILGADSLSHLLQAGGLLFACSWQLQHGPALR